MSYYLCSISSIYTLWFIKTFNVYVFIYTRMDNRPLYHEKRTDDIVNSSVIHKTGFKSKFFVVFYMYVFPYIYIYYNVISMML